MVFEDRTDAGRRLAADLVGLREEHPLVFGLPRGGVPVAAEVARGLRAPLEVLVVRKLGAPRNRELAVGALAEGGTAITSSAGTFNLQTQTGTLVGVTSSGVRVRSRIVR